METTSTNNVSDLSYPPILASLLQFSAPFGSSGRWKALLPVNDGSDVLLALWGRGVARCPAK